MGIGIDVSPTFCWLPSINATSYRLQVSTSADCSSPIKDFFNIFEDTLNLGFYGSSPLSLNTNYYWRVAAINNGAIGSWSSTRSFTTKSKPPQLLYPANGAQGVETMPVLRWSHSESMANYRVQMSTSNQFILPFKDVANITDTSLLIESLSNYTQYFWRVIVENSGASSSTSAVFTFTTGFDPASLSPTIIWPPSGAVNVPQQFLARWSNVNSARSYHVIVSTKPDFSVISMEITSIRDTIIQISDLQKNTQYFWSVQALTPSGYSAWSITSSFTLTPGLPGQVTVVSPSDFSRVSADSVKMIWRKSAPVVTRYCLRVATDSAMSHVFYMDSLITDTTKMVQNLIGNTVYWWQVKAFNMAGWGPFSQKRRFSVPSTGVLPKQVTVRSFDCSGSSGMLRYALPQQCFVSVQFFDLSGKQIASMVNRVQDAGYYTADIPVATWAKGSYVQIFRAGSYVHKSVLVLAR